MRFRKRLEKGLKHLAVAVIVAAAGAFLALRWYNAHNTVAPPAKQQTGYKAADRERLERLIHEGAKDD